MAGEKELKKQRFDNDAAASLMKELRTTYASGKTKSYEWRVAQLKGIAMLVSEKENEIVEALYTDLSKPETEAHVTEISMAKSACNHALKDLKQWMKPEKVKGSILTFPSSAEIVSEPLGVVLVIAPWNYPFLLAIDPVIGAIAAGNAVVLKPSEVSPATSSFFAKYLEEYVDRSAVRVVEGNVDETTALLEQNWDKIFYTGNGKVGRIIMAAAAKHLTPVVLELGGKSPLIVDSNVNLEVAARRIVAGKWGSNSGQTCVSPDYIITTKAFAPTLIDAMKNTLEQFFGKDPKESKDMSRIVNSNHFARLTQLLDEDKVSSKIIHGGQRDEKRLYISPTILLDAPEDSKIMNEEIFGPLLPIVTVDKVENSFDVINSKPKPLAAYLFSNNKKLEEEFVSTISAGGMLINDTIVHLANPSLPFGGVGESGTGSYHGKFSFEAFSHKKAVLHRGFGGDAPMRYPPYTPAKQRLLKALLEGSIFGIIRALIGWPRV
ncbi:aldehyde dehydrogenase family 3 member H1-like [Telopea speciosissima]|uniref:aldehyde dehydrogenase family 3 member H1-like n=1 Tax=Telopea speciosissima TaxID=54955 RepID=UPI001CC5EF81|nr:aldehyde dehydrogenase family 3 member H1-like [Telopea speciosissima]